MCLCLCLSLFIPSFRYFRLYFPPAYPMASPAVQKRRSIFEKLSDPSTFHASHKHRFDPATGKGLGLQGRERICKGSGTGLGVPGFDFATMLRENLTKFGSTMSPAKGRSVSPSPGSQSDRNSNLPGMNFSPVARPRSTSQTGGSIFDKLSDPKTFQGSHRHRFDQEGKGRGKAGRSEHRVDDLSQITRPHLS